MRQVQEVDEVGSEVVKEDFMLPNSRRSIEVNCVTLSPVKASRFEVVVMVMAA